MKMKKDNYKIKRVNKPRKLKTKIKKYEFVIEIYDSNGKRRNRYYTTLANAEEDYTRMLQKISQEKVQPEKRQSAKDVIEFREATAYAESIGMTLDDMVSEYIEVQRLLASHNRSNLEKALERYVAWREKNDINITLGEAINLYANSEYFAGLRDSTKKCSRSILNRLVVDFGITTPLACLSTQKVEKWVTNLVKTHKYQTPGEVISLSTQHTTLRTLAAFWKFCMKKGFVSKNVPNEIYLCRPKRQDPQIYTPEEVSAIIQLTPPYSDLRLYACLAVFVGLRPVEICKLRWSAINITDKEIQLGSDVTKMSIRRVVNIPDNLIEWLQPWEKKFGSKALVLKNGPSTQWCFLRRLRLSGIPPIHDGLRHTCASYLFAKTNNSNYTAQQLGHCVAILNKNYKGLARKHVAEEFYSIRPDIDGQPEIRMES